MPRRSRFFQFNSETGKVVESTRNVSKLRPRYPLAIEALAVHPSQIPEAIEHDRAHGVPTDYRRDGSPIVQDPSHYRQYRRMHGTHHKNCYNE